MVGRSGGPIMATAKPDMSVIWALAGSSVKPPDTKIQEGWLAEKPPFQSENWVQQRQDQYLKHIDERGVAEWGNQSEYEQGALAWYNNLIWESLQPANLGNIPQNGLGFWLSQDYLDRRGDIMSGGLVLEQGLNLTHDLAKPGSEAIEWFLNGIIRAKIGRSITPSNTDFTITLADINGAISNTLALKENGTGYIDGGLIWTRTNDGQGSGLDADLLDGQHLSDILASVSRGSIAYSVPGVYNFTVPPSVYTVFISLSGSGRGGQGGGDPTSCPSISIPGGDVGLPTIIAGQLNTLTANGGDVTLALIEMTLTTATLSSTQLISFGAELAGYNPPGTNIGGLGANTPFGIGGIGDSRLGGPFVEWTGVRGGGGAGGGTTGNEPSFGGNSGAFAILVPFRCVPGEILTITIQDGGAGSVGCRSTGGLGGSGYAEINW